MICLTRLVFSKLLRGLIHSAGKVAKGEHSRVVACGEGVALLWAEGKADARDSA